MSKTCWQAAKGSFGLQGMNPCSVPTIVNGTVTGWSFTKSCGNTTEPVKFHVPVKETFSKVTPLRMTVPRWNPIFHVPGFQTPPTFRTDPGPQGAGRQVANVRFPGSPPEAA